MTRWLLSQYCHCPSRDLPKTSIFHFTSHLRIWIIWYDIFIYESSMEIDISYDILMPVDDGSQKNLVVALTCFRLEGTELFPLLTGDKTNYNYASKLFSFGFQHQSELSLRSANQSPSTCCDLSEYIIGSWTFFYFNPRWNFYLFSIEWNISPWQSGVKKWVKWARNVLKMVNFTPEASQMLSANISPVLVTDWALISSTDLTLNSLGSVSSVFSFTNIEKSTYPILNDTVPDKY